MVYFWGLLALSLVVYAFNLFCNRKYSQITAECGQTGSEAARQILARAGIENVAVEELERTFYDYYAPKSLTLCLSAYTMNCDDLASLCRAAHEAAHVLQHHEGSALIWLRTVVIKIVNYIPPYILCTSLLKLVLVYQLRFTFDLALVIMIPFIVGMLLALLALPAEIDASFRAYKLLSANGDLRADERRGARLCLLAATLVYVAAIPNYLFSWLFGRLIDEEP